MTLTLASVFAPLAFATGRTGRLFIEFALTLAGAVMVSGFIALTLTPMMCSLLLKHRGAAFVALQHDRGGLDGDDAAATAARSPRRCARAGSLSSLWFVGRRAGRALLHRCSSPSSSPIEDRGVVFGLVTAPQGSTPQYTADQIKPIEEFYSQIPEAAAYTAISGFPTVVDGNAVLRLKPWEERTKKQQQIADELRPEVRRDSRRDRVSDQSAVARAVVPVDAGRIRRDVAGARTPSCSAPSTGSSTRCASIPASRTCRSTCASTRRRCASTSTATSFPTSASASTRSGGRWRRCWAGARSRDSSATASSTT